MRIGTCPSNTDPTQNPTNATIAPFKPSKAPCDCDFVQINDGHGSASEKILQACGTTIPKEVLSSLNFIWIRFVSDGITESDEDGFVAKIVLQECK